MPSPCSRWSPPCSSSAGWERGRTPRPGAASPLCSRLLGHLLLAFGIVSEFARADAPFRGLLCLYRALRTRPGARAILLRAQPADHGRLACAIVGGVLARRRRGALRRRAVAVVAPRHCRDVDGLSLPPPPRRCPRQVPTSPTSSASSCCSPSPGSSSCGAMPAETPLPPGSRKACSPWRRCRCLRFHLLRAVLDVDGFEPLSGGSALVSVAWGVLSVALLAGPALLLSSSSRDTGSAGLVYWSSKSGLRRARAGGCQVVPLRPRGSSAHPAHTSVLRLRDGVPARCLPVRRRKGQNPFQHLIAAKTHS